MNKSNKLMSLFDYLGRPAGLDLGNRVYKSAKEHGLMNKLEERQVKTKYYEGKVMLYPEWFLDKYFNIESLDI